MKSFVEELYAQKSRKIFATLIRLVGDFELAEESMHEAFTVALQNWSESGIPTNPQAWLISTARHKAIDQLRRKKRVSEREFFQIEEFGTANQSYDEEHIRDDQLRLIFTCCHPSLSNDAQIALTLREMVGMPTEEIAHAFICKPTTIAQRIVRAKNKIKTANIPYEVPGRDQLYERLHAVLYVIYLIYNEGYTTSVGTTLTRKELTAVAIRLARRLCELLPEAEVKGLLSLLLLQDSRRMARVSKEGDLITLEDQDRTLWNSYQIEEGREILLETLHNEGHGYFTLQAAIAALHAESPSYEKTDWSQITGLYTVLLRRFPSPVIELNYAVAVAMSKGCEEGLQIIETILQRGELKHYHYIHSAKAELCFRIGDNKQAYASFQKALRLTKQEPEKRYLKRKIREIKSLS